MISAPIAVRCPPLWLRRPARWSKVPPRCRRANRGGLCGERAGKDPHSWILGAIPDPKFRRVEIPYATQPRHGNGSPAKVMKTQWLVW